MEAISLKTPLSLAALFSPTSRAVDSVDERILEAALEQFVLVGIRRTSGDDIARRAGINRTTLYRRMGTKDEILYAAITHEVGRILAAIAAEMDHIIDIEERFVTGFASTVTLLRELPLLNRILEVDQEDALVWLTVEAGPTIRLATTFLEQQVNQARSELGLPAIPNAESMAAIMVRLVQSLVLTPDAPPSLESPEQLRAFAADLVQLMIGMGRTA